MKKVAVMLSIMLLAAGASAQMYKWVDKDGKVQYTQTPPPPGTKTEKTITAPRRSGAGAKPGAVPSAKTAAEQEADFRKRKVEQEEKGAKSEKSEAEEKQRQAQCTSAKSNLSQLEQGGRIAKYDEKGERSFLEDADRPNAIAEAQKAVDSWCNPAK